MKNYILLLFAMAIFCLGCNKPEEKEAELTTPQPKVEKKIETVYTQKIDEQDNHKVPYTVKYTVTYNLRIVEFVHPKPFSALVVEQVDDNRPDGKHGIHQNFTDGLHPVQVEIFYIKILGGRNRFCMKDAEGTYYDIETKEIVINPKPKPYEIVPLTATKVEDKRQSEEFRKAKALCEKYPSLKGITWEKKNDNEESKG